MRKDCYNFADVESATEDYRRTAMTDPLYLVFHTPDETVFRYIVTRKGIVRQDCDKTGAPLQ